MRASICFDIEADRINADALAEMVRVHFRRTTVIPESVQVSVLHEGEPWPPEGETVSDKAVHTTEPWMNGNPCSCRTCRGEHA